MNRQHPGKSPLDQYLSRYAEPETGSLGDARPTGIFKRALVVACYAEAEDFLQQMNIPDESETLIIVVVNQPDDAASAESARTHRLLNSLRQTVAATAAQNLLVIDRVTQPIPRRQGVGLARKIGADIAASLIAERKVASPWIYFSDADVELPRGYFQPRPPVSGTMLYPYRHRAASAEMQRRVDLYELHLRYYCWQLRDAGSRYAFPTLGSIMAVHAETYAQVRGVPKRNAAEDFYLLNKLAKIAPIVQLPEPIVSISGRASTRVPFGTGPALARIPEDSDRYLSYAPEVFGSLRATLTALEHLALHGDWQLDDSLAQSWLDTLGWQTFAARLAEVVDPVQRTRRIHDWFDAFRTMRYVRLAAHAFPDRPLLDSVRGLLPDATPSQTPAEVLELLIEREKRITDS